MPTLKLILALLPFPLIAFAQPADSSPVYSPTSKRVAFVIDDGPHPELTPLFHKTLADQGIVATFAQVGNTVARHPELSKAAISAGHEVVNHSLTHAHPNQIDDELLEMEIVGAQKKITQSLGFAPKWYWPPFLELDDRMEPLFEKAGITRFKPISLVDSHDWKRELTAEDIFRNATTNVQDGSVILFHEWRQETLDAFPAIIQELKRQGCAFYTFSQLDQELARNPVQSSN